MDSAPARIRKDARISVCIALGIALLWVSGIGAYAIAGPGLTTAFGSHLANGLAMFCVIVGVPIALVAFALNWIVRRVAGTIITLLFVGMVHGGTSQGFGIIGDIGVVLVTGLLVGSMLFFLSRPSVMSATGDFYNFLSIRDVLSRYTFRRKLMEAAPPR